MKELGLQNYLEILIAQSHGFDGVIKYRKEKSRHAVRRLKEYILNFKPTMLESVPNWKNIS